MSDPFNPSPPQTPGEGQDSWQEVMGGFPRHLTRQLIVEGDAGRARKEQLAGWLVGLALALFALARPEERWLETLAGDTWRGVAPGAVGWGVLAQQLAFKLPLTAASLGLFVSALAYGLCLPLALSIARQLGIGWRLALPTSLALLLAPGLWTAATTPGPGTLALMLGLLVLRELWCAESPRPLPVLGLWLASAGLDVNLAWTLPAVVWACFERGKASSKGAALVLAPLACVGYAAWLGLQVMTQRGASLSTGLTESYLFGPSASLSAPLSWLLSAPLTLGLALLGIASLFWLRRNEAESAPPRWLLAWCVLPAALCACTGEVPLGFSFIWLVPPALIGSLDLVARQDERVGLAWAWAGLCAQVLLLVGALALLAANDPTKDWREHARHILEPGDWVLTADRGHLFMLRDRWGLEAELLEDKPSAEDWLSRARAASAAGRRVVLDLDPASPWQAQWTRAFEGLPGLLELRTPRDTQSPAR